jgi:hypothetical protein
MATKIRYVKDDPDGGIAAGTEVFMNEPRASRMIASGLVVRAGNVAVSAPVPKPVVEPIKPVEQPKPFQGKE